MKILIVEDNEKLLNSIHASLSSEDFVCETAISYNNAEDKVMMYNYDTLIIDVNLPDGSGLNLFKKAKQVNASTGIIVISARNSLDNKIEGLDLGADDYITKPFDMPELVARVKALIRRKNFNGNSTIQFGDVIIDTAKKEVSALGINLGLTKSEFDILLFFFSNPKRVLTREGIAEHIMGDNMDMADSFDFIYSHIKNIRKKIKQAGGADPIRVVYGVGYKLDHN